MTFNTPCEALAFIKRMEHEMDYSAVISAGSAALSAVFAAVTIWYAERKSSDAILTHEAKECLEKAYEALTAGMPADGVPLPDRLNWLTSARRLLRFKEIQSKVKSKQYKLSLSIAEADWRGRFSDVLDGILGPRESDGASRLLHASSAYFEGSPGERLSIDYSSAVVIHAFSIWPKNEHDILEEKAVGRILNERPNVWIRYPNLRAYKHKVEARRNPQPLPPSSPTPP